MAKNILQTKTDPLSYNRVPFEDLKLNKPAKKKVSRVTGKPMKSWQAMGTEKPVNPSQQPKGTTFGAKIN